MEKISFNCLIIIKCNKSSRKDLFPDLTWTI